MTGLIETSAAALDWQRHGYGTGVSVLLVVVLLTELLLYPRHARVHAQQRKDLPPGPRPWPTVGKLPALANGNLQHLAAKFGPIMSLRLGLPLWVAAELGTCWFGSLLDEGEIPFTLQHGPPDHKGTEVQFRTVSSTSLKGMIPSKNIQWTVPEGGGGPGYPVM